MDHFQLSLTACEPEQENVTDFWALVDEICDRHGIATAGDTNPSPEAEPER